MRPHREFTHAYETTRNYNSCISMIDGITLYLVDKNYDGTILNADLELLKNFIYGLITDIGGLFGKLETFLNNHELYDLTRWTDRTRLLILADKVTSDTGLAALQDNISSPSIGNKTKLAQIEFVNPFTYAAPIILDTEHHYAIMLNDWLDASAYTLQGIRQDNGLPNNFTDEEKRYFVRGWLSQWGNIAHYEFGPTIQTDVDEMTNAKDYILENLDTMDTNTLGAWIDANIPKVPLMRRLWALGQ